ncbi:MAG: MaoC family dehydratase [Burkholderiaceae bacterium]|nr:MaoC family dehydratase [Burkholderiaceae bacterium]
MSNEIQISSADDALNKVGQTLGVSNWHLVDQESIDAFGAITGDQQWLHSNPEKAQQGPFGGCVAHGLYTLGLAGGRFFHETVHINARMGVNYGCNRVRYPAPLLVGKRIRGYAFLKEVGPLAGDGVQLVVELTVEIEGEPKPACVADFIVRYFF